MGVLKYIYIIIAGILTSFYLFPFEFSFLPGVNTKMAMAGFSLLILLFNKATVRDLLFRKDLLILTIIALVFSLMCFMSVVVNATNDMTYCTFFVSMWVWLGGAYTLTTCLRSVHGYVSVRLILNYLIAVCVSQCILAIVIDSVPSMQQFLNSIIVGFDFVGLDRLENSERLYGIGAALDVAGIRFSIALVAIAFLATDLYKTNQLKALPLYVIAFVIIAIVGNMIARTTTVGLVIAIVLWIVYFFLDHDRFQSSRLMPWLMVIVGVAVSYSIYKYNIDQHFKEQITFAFEGFFSLANDGTWDVTSNNNLKNMIVFPDNIKTWLIGDGYLENPRATDPYYVGPFYRGYYMGTDIGYLRIIFYSGIFTLGFFIFFFYKSAESCAKLFPEYRVLFWLILLVNYIVWFKVATDVFLIFALFLCINEEEEENAERKLILPEYMEDKYENPISDPLDI